MRKLFIILAVVLGLSGCSSAPVKSAHSIDDTMDVTAMHFTSEEHQYILFAVGYKWAGVVHDPDCWCMIDPD
jgi:ABC-type glycerol-3-phosphate transport system substrate-binding protein